MALIIIDRIIKALSCSDLYRYVFNDCHCHSNCMEWCDIECDTDKVDIVSDHENDRSPDVSYELDVGDLFHLKRVESN